MSSTVALISCISSSDRPRKGRAGMAKHTNASELPGTVIISSQPFMDVEAGDADLHEERHVRNHSVEFNIIK